MNKKQITMLAVGVIAIVAIYWFFFRKKDETKKESSFNPDYLVIGDEMGYKRGRNSTGRLEYYCDPNCVLTTTGGECGDITGTEGITSYGTTNCTTCVCSRGINKKPKLRAT